MSLINPREYQQYDYIAEKDRVSERLKKDFIEGILNACKYRKKIKMKTHKWMVENVIGDKRIKSSYDIRVIEVKKPIFLKTEILILLHEIEIEFRYKTIKEIINHGRKGYIVKLRYKE